jgi:hypothetical protein
MLQVRELSIHEPIAVLLQEKADSLEPPRLLDFLKWSELSAFVYHQRDIGNWDGCSISQLLDYLTLNNNGMFEMTLVSYTGNWTLDQETQWWCEQFREFKRHV